MIRTRFLAAALAVAALPAAANADVAYTQVNPNSLGIQWNLSKATKVGSLSDIDTAGDAYTGLRVNLTLTDGSMVDALFNLSGSSSAAALRSPAGVYEQDGISGNFSFKGLNGEDYLTGTFTNAAITGSNNAGSAPGGSGSFFSTENGTVTYTSGSQAVGTTPGNFSVALNSVRPGFSAATNSPLNSFKATSGGTFGQAVPELSAWAMMLVGFAGIGMVVRRRGLALPGRPALA